MDGTTPYLVFLTGFSEPTASPLCYLVWQFSKDVGMDGLVTGYTVRCSIQGSWRTPIHSPVTVWLIPGMPTTYILHVHVDAFSDRSGAQSTLQSSLPAGFNMVASAVASFDVKKLLSQLSAPAPEYYPSTTGPLHMLPSCCGQLFCLLFHVFFTTVYHKDSTSWAAAVWYAAWYFTYVRFNLILRFLNVLHSACKDNQVPHQHRGAHCFKSFSLQAFYPPSMYMYVCKPASYIRLFECPTKDDQFHYLLPLPNMPSVTACTCAAASWKYRHSTQQKESIFGLNYHHKVDFTEESITYKPKKKIFLFFKKKTKKNSALST